MNVTIFSNDIIMNIGVVFFFVLFLFIFFLLFTFILSLFAKEKKSSFTPKISVIIPCYNEEKNITNCLNSILASDYSQKLMEIIVVDDSSSDNTASVVKKFIKEHKKCKIKLLHQKHSGKAMALNLGLKHSSNEFIVTIDADAILDKNCIRELVAPLYLKDVGATNCVSLIHEPKNMIEHFQNIEYCYNSLVRVSFTKLYKSGIWFFGMTACYNRKALERVGMFKKDTLTEDMDISLELYRKHYKTLTTPRAISYTKGCHTIKTLFNQRARWWFGVLQALIKNRAILKENSASTWFLYMNQFWWTFYSIFSLPLFIYQIRYWMPSAIYEQAIYLFRWFSLLGPVYVLYKIPEWGISFLNIFGVLSGIISVFLIIAAFAVFRKKMDLLDMIAAFFYFPYTIVLNLVIIFSLIKYLRPKKHFFMN